MLHSFFKNSVLQRLPPRHLRPMRECLERLHVVFTDESAVDERAGPGGENGEACVGEGAGSVEGARGLLGGGLGSATEVGGQGRVPGGLGGGG